MTIRNDATRLRVPQRDKRLRRGVLARQGQVLLDTDLNQQGEALLGRVEAEALAIMGSPGKLVYPAGTSGFAVTPDGAVGNFNIGSGEGYVDGWRLENPLTAKLLTQFHPCASTVTLPALVAVKALVRHIDPVEERALPDVALGDAQASGRCLNDWQVLPIAVTAADPLTDPAWIGLKAPSNGKLMFKPKAGAASTDICSLTPTGGYSRHENALYRIEVHGGVVAEQRADGPRFALNGLKLKLSRRNASTMARIVKVDGSDITVTPPALDPRNWFASGTWAEIVSIHDDLDPVKALANERMFPVGTVRQDEIVTLAASAAAIALTGATGPAAPGEEGDWFLRLWDAIPTGVGGQVTGLATVSAPGGAADSAEIDLGDGVAIQLTGGAGARFRRGDYWTCAVRADGSIAWPSGALAAVAEPPHGPEVRYAPLALITNGGITDLRIPLATLTDKAMLYRGGDGQMAAVGSGGLVTLPAKLRIAVMRGESPVPGAKVRWQVKLPVGTAGTLSGAGQTSTDIVVPTNDQGISEVDWAIDPAQPSVLHQVSADLDDGLQPGTPPMLFSAGFDREGSHIGCSTYVIPEGSDWVGLLEQMDFGQDIAVCFQRGEFRTSRPVVLKGTRNIKISGAGDGTVLLARKGETVLELQGFASAVVERLRIETRDANGQKDTKPGATSGRNGALTLRGCQVSEVRKTTLRCGGRLAPECTALTIAGNEERPVKLARVVDNRVIACFLQDGILLTDCRDITVSGNVLHAAKRSAVLGDPVVADSLAWKRVVARALADRFEDFRRASTAPDLRVLRLGVIVVEFLSPVPQEEWDRLLKERPFDGGRRATEAQVRSYLESLVDGALNGSIRAGETMSLILEESRRRGGHLGAADRRTMALATLMPSGIQVSEGRRVRPDRTASNRYVAEGDTLGFGDFGLRFESPVPKPIWAQLLNDDSVWLGGSPRSAADFSRIVRSAAMMVAGDGRIRTKFSALDAWYKADAAASLSAARQGITCGGAVLGNVAINGNRVSGFGCGVHVAASVQSSRGNRIVLNARIADNDLALQLPSKLHYYPAGLFLGNVETGRIDCNVLSRSDGVEENGGWRHGIRVWGALGRYLMIAENRISGPQIGIKVRPTNMSGSKPDPTFLWVARDNLVDWVPVSNVLHAPPLVQDRDNRPG